MKAAICAFVDKMCANPRCPNCQRRDAELKGSKAVCRYCGNVWNWTVAPFVARLGER